MIDTDDRYGRRIRIEAKIVGGHTTWMVTDAQFIDLLWRARDGSGFADLKRLDGLAIEYSGEDGPGISAVYKYEGMA